METACAPFFCAASEHAFTLHSSPFIRKSLCLSAFRGVKSLQRLFTHSSPLFTDSVSADLQFAAVWVTIADLKSAKRTDARRANSLEADCRRTSQGEEWWRVGEEWSRTLHPSKRPQTLGILKERWRVKSISLSFTYNIFTGIYADCCSRTAN